MLNIIYITISAILVKIGIFIFTFFILITKYVQNNNLNIEGSHILFVSRHDKQLIPLVNTFILMAETHEKKTTISDPWYVSMERV